MAGTNQPDTLDIARGERIKARRQELHLTQPAVVDLIEKAAYELPDTHELHPDRAGKAPVTLRGYQTYEGGGGIVWEKAKLLAQVLQIDVQEMMNGALGEYETPLVSSGTPSPFAGRDDLTERLKRQSRILARIEQAIELEDEAARRLADDGEAWTDRVLALLEAHRDEPQTPGRERRRPGSSDRRQGATQKPA